MNSGRLVIMDHPDAAGGNRRPHEFARFLKRATARVALIAVVAGTATTVLPSPGSAAEPDPIAGYLAEVSGDNILASTAAIVSYAPRTAQSYQRFGANPPAMDPTIYPTVAAAKNGQAGNSQ